MVPPRIAPGESTIGVYEMGSLRQGLAEALHVTLMQVMPAYRQRRNHDGKRDRYASYNRRRRSISLYVERIDATCGQVYEQPTLISSTERIGSQVRILYGQP
jgi:hypothetical protein